MQRCEQVSIVPSASPRQSHRHSSSSETAFDLADARTLGASGTEAQAAIKSGIKQTSQKRSIRDSRASDVPPAFYPESTVRAMENCTVPVRNAPNAGGGQFFCVTNFVTRYPSNVSDPPSLP